MPWQDPNNSISNNNVQRPGAGVSNILFNSSNYDTTTSNYKMVNKLSPPVDWADCEVALLDMTYYNSFFNIQAAKGNNTIPFTVPIFAGTVPGTGSGTVTNHSDVLVLKDGFYTLTDLNNALNNYMVQQGYYLFNSDQTTYVFFLQIVNNAVTYQTELYTFYVPTLADLSDPDSAAYQWTIPFSNSVISNSAYAFTATNLNNSQNVGGPPGVPRATMGITIGPASGPKLKGGLGYIIGFPSGVVVTNPNNGIIDHYSNTPLSVGSTAAAQINPVTAIIVRCNMINNTIGQPTDMLCQVTPYDSFGAINIFQATFPTFSPTVNQQYEAVVLQFMDQNLDPLNFFDNELTMTVQIRARR